MIGRIIDGKQIAENIESDIKEKISSANTSPRLGLIYGNGQENYAKMISKLCEKLGIEIAVHMFPNTASEKEVIHLIKVLNADHQLDGILFHRPMPMSDENAIKFINSSKDLYGYYNYKTNCISQAVKTILDKNEIPIEGRHIVIINRNRYLGRLLSQIFLDNDATITVCHSKTFDLSWHTSQADIIITATGKPSLLNKEMVKEGATVIDVGMTMSGDKWTGDASEDVKEKVAYITPVPGGVGPVVNAMILKNLVENFEKREVGKTTIMI